jgi:predicted anti-sigma-YlaC factor YlaD
MTWYLIVGCCVMAVACAADTKSRVSVGIALLGVALWPAVVAGALGKLFWDR